MASKWEALKILVLAVNGRELSDRSVRFAVVPANGTEWAISIGFCEGPGRHPLDRDRVDYAEMTGSTVEQALDRAIVKVADRIRASMRVPYWNEFVKGGPAFEYSLGRARACFEALQLAALEVQQAERVVEVDATVRT